MTNTPFEHAPVEDIIPYIDANFRTLPVQRNRAMAGLSMGGAYTHRITLARLDKFSHIGMFSGGSIAASEIKEMCAGVNAVYYESPLTAHVVAELAPELA